MRTWLSLLILLFCALVSGRESVHAQVTTWSPVQASERFEVDWQQHGAQLRVRMGQDQSFVLTELSARQSHLKVHEQRGSFDFQAEHVASACQQWRILQAIPEAETLTFEGEWLERECHGKRWFLTLVLSPEQHLEWRVRSAAPELNQFQVAFQTDANEHWYGGGEQFTFPRLNGQRLPVWVQENGIGRGLQPLSALLTLAAPGAAGHAFSSYISVPWLLSSRARGLYLAQSEYAELDLSEASRVRISVWAPEMRLRLLAAPSPLELLTRYTRWAGRMPVPPAWVDQGAWVGMQGGTERVRQVWQELRQRQTPLAAFWLQDWVGKRQTVIGSQLWWNWTINSRQYPQWAELVRDLRAEGLRVLGYLNPFLVEMPTVFKGRHLYQEALARGFFLRNASGEVVPVQNTDFSAGMLDLTQPEARRWFMQVVEEQMIAQGFSGWMADYAEAFPEQAVTATGEGFSRAHNTYPEAWAQLQRDLVAAHPEHELVVFLRSGFSQSPRWAPFFWEGDQLVSWDGADGLRSAVQGLISGGLSGFSLNHSDAGGYTSVCQHGLGWCRSSELLMRWLEVNAWTPLLRTHEGNQPEAQVQFYRSAEGLDFFDRSARIYRAWRFLRRELFTQAAEQGWPVVRHLMLHYPEQPVAAHIHDQYLLGPDVLVAPILTSGQRQRRLWLPPGPWIHLWSGVSCGLYTRGAWVEVPAPLGQAPVFWRQGSLTGQKLAQAFQSLSEQQVPPFRCLPRP